MNIEEIKRQAELAAEWYHPELKNGVHINWTVLNRMLKALIAANELLQQQQWQPIERGYKEAPTYLCYFPDDVKKYRVYSVLSLAEYKGATHYMIPQPPKDTK
jgi:hypothetical protein